MGKLKVFWNVFGNCFQNIIFENGFDVGWVVNFKIFHGGNGINGMSPSYEKAKGQLGM